MRKSELFIRLVTSASVMMYGFDLGGSAYAVFLADKLFIVKDKSSIDSFLSWSLAYPLLIAADGMAFDTRLVNYVKKKGGLYILLTTRILEHMKIMWQETRFAYTQRHQPSGGKCFRFSIKLPILPQLYIH